MYLLLFPFQPTISMAVFLAVFALLSAGFASYWAAPFTQTDATRLQTHTVLMSLHAAAFCVLPGLALPLAWFIGVWVGLRCDWEDWQERQ